MPLVSMETMTDTPSDLTDHLGYWLRAISNRVSQDFAARMAAEGVSVAEWVMLRSLYAAPQPPSVLAGTMAMTRGAITKLADRLIARGLAVRRPSDTDGRAHTLALSRKGAELVPRLAAIADANDAAFFAGLAPADRRTLMRLMKDLATRHAISAAPTD